MPRKCFLDIVTKHFFPCPKNYFSLHKNFFLAGRKHLLMPKNKNKKNLVVRNKMLLSPHQENIPLAAEIISVGYQA